MNMFVFCWSIPGNLYPIKGVSWEGERDLFHFNVVAISITPDFKFFLNIV